MDFTPLFDSECWKCGSSPTVGICQPKGPEDTRLCGPHFFVDPSMVQWSEWESSNED